MEKKRKSPQSTRVEKSAEWERRHEDDAGGPIADNRSELPDRTSRVAEGSPGEASSMHGSGFQTPAEAVHPTFPAAGEKAVGQADDDVRLRAYQIWEDEGFPEDNHERHWLQAERELRGDRS